jgi:hypothetical protein
MLELEVVPTVGEAVTVIRNSLTKFNDNPVISDFDASVATLAINENLQIRDFVMGIPAEGLDVRLVLSWLESLKAVTPKELSTPALTILSAFYYEIGALPQALISLGMADEDYSLAKLLTKVIGAGWPAEALASMRNELHPKVLDTLQETWDEVVIEK